MCDPAGGGKQDGDFKFSQGCRHLTTTDFLVEQAWFDLLQGQRPREISETLITARQSLNPEGGMTHVGSRTATRLGGLWGHLPEEDEPSQQKDRILIGVEGFAGTISLSRFCRSTWSPCVGRAACIEEVLKDPGS